MIIFMFGIVLTIVLFIAMGFVRGEGMSWRVNKKQLLALVGVLVIVFSCYVSIPAGHTGVVTTFGSVENYTLEAGMHFKLPWQEVIKMDNRVQKSTQDMSCFSSDIQEVSMTYTVNYQISKQDAMTIYKTIGIGYYDTVIAPCITESVKIVTAQYTAEDLVSSRSLMAAQIEEVLSKSWRPTILSWSALPLRIWTSRTPLRMLWRPSRSPSRTSSAPRLRHSSASSRPMPLRRSSASRRRLMPMS